MVASALFFAVRGGGKELGQDGLREVRLKKRRFFRRAGRMC